MAPDSRKNGDAFQRGDAENAVESVMERLGIGGDVVDSEEEGVVAFMTEDMADLGAVQEALEAEGFEVAAVETTKWQVDQYDPDVEDDACYDERVIAVAFDCPGLSDDWRGRGMAAAPAGA